MNSLSSGPLLLDSNQESTPTSPTIKTLFHRQAAIFQERSEVFEGEGEQELFTLGVALTINTPCKGPTREKQLEGAIRERRRAILQKRFDAMRAEKAKKKELEEMEKQERKEMEENGQKKETKI